MEATQLDTAVVDRCSQCDGVWMDFFDGEFASLARQIEFIAIPGEPSPASISCVDCHANMPRVAYLDRGPPIHRCPECLGTFATPVQLEALAEYFEREKAEPPGWWIRFWEWAHRL